MQSASTNIRQEVKYTNCCANLAVIQHFIKTEGCLCNVDVFKHNCADTQNCIRVRSLQ